MCGSFLDDLLESAVRTDDDHGAMERSSEGERIGHEASLECETCVQMGDVDSTTRDGGPRATSSIRRDAGWGTTVAEGTSNDSVGIATSATTRGTTKTSSPSVRRSETAPRPTTPRRGVSFTEPVASRAVAVERAVLVEVLIETQRARAASAGRDAPAATRATITTGANQRIADGSTLAHTSIRRRSHVDRPWQRPQIGRDRGEACTKPRRRRTSLRVAR